MNAITLEIIIILLLLVANGVFAMTEMAMVSSRKSRLRLLAERGAAGKETKRNGTSEAERRGRGWGQEPRGPSLGALRRVSCAPRASTHILAH